jgi:F0F1-type ATP synthase membrane subunit a
MIKNELFRKINKLVFLAITMLIFCFQANSQTLSPPPQDQGLPYTKSAKPLAMAKIKNYIAVFSGSRYARVKGFKVRLDDVNWRDEAINQHGIL